MPLVAQMNATAFSYCLAPHGAGKKSTLLLGDSVKHAGVGCAMDSMSWFSSTRFRSGNSIISYSLPFAAPPALMPEKN